MMPPMTGSVSISSSCSRLDEHALYRCCRRADDRHRLQSAGQSRTRAEGHGGNAHYSDNLAGRLADVIDDNWQSSSNTALRKCARRGDGRLARQPRQRRALELPLCLRCPEPERLAALAPTYDGFIDRWIASIPDSAERAALFSLTWNAPSLLGPKLKAAILDGNRAEAWYEIRYNSNGIALAGIANRRYVEAEEFGCSTSPARPALPRRSAPAG